jgi:TolB-like protein
VLEAELPIAKCVVVVWSENSIRSRWVKTEAMEALERECIVPVRLDAAAPPLAFRHVQILDAAEPNFIETIIRRVGALAGPPKKRASATHSSGHTSIAVLPFENLSRDPAQEYFSDGITEALITSLAQIHALKVISRTSVMRFKGQRKGLREIAAELGVERIIEGSVICAGSRVRITAQLIDASSDTHEWAESFDRDLADVLAIQDEIARLVAERVSVRLTPRET